MRFEIEDQGYSKRLLIFEEGQKSYTVRAEIFPNKNVNIDLPHQCDDWVIGNLQSTESFIKCLEAAIKWAKEELSG
jgi:hypothetical protein